MGESTDGSTGDSYVRPTHRSVSQLNKYRQCSESYRLSYVDKVTSNSPAAWLAQGSAFHVAVEGWELSGRSSGFDMSTAFMVEYDQQIGKMKFKEPDLKKWLHSFKTSTEDDIKARRIKGVEQVLGYFNYASNNPFAIADIDDYTLAVEVEFEVEIGGVLVKGAIDQVLMAENGYEVRDLKTGNREQTLLQLGVYRVAMEKIFGWPIVKASYYYAKDDKVVTVSKTELDRFSESYLGELLRSLEAGIENKVFIPNPGSQCVMCPVKKYCRELGSEPKHLS